MGLLMKKLISLLLTVVLCLSACSFAFAEDVVEVDLCENGAWVPFTDYGFQVYLPSDWLVLETTDEQTASGVIAVFASPDGARTFNVAYTEFDEATDLDAVSEELAANYDNVALLTINNTDYVTYDIPENDVTGLCTLGGSGIGFYQFVFYPASDEEYGQLAVQIAASLSTIEE